MRLIPLAVGNVVTQMSVIDRTEGSIDLPVVAWLIEHPDGLVLFDAGMHRDLQVSFDRIGQATASRFRPDFSPGEEVSARLTSRGIRPSDITHLVLSHLHFDHAGGTCELPDARIVVQADEWQAGQDPQLVEWGIYNPDDYALGHDVEQVSGEHDLFGDARIITVPTPGHTVGHQSLRVELESGPVVLTGDCVYTETLFDAMAVPAFTKGDARDRQLESMQYLARLRDDHGCRLMFGHDANQFKTLPADGLT